MARPPAGSGKVIVDAYVCVPQRRASCYDCGSVYTGTEAEVACRGCGRTLATKEAGVKKIPTGCWALFRDKGPISNSSIMGEAAQSGESDVP